MPELSTLSKIVIGSAAVAASVGAVYYLFRKEEVIVTEETDKRITPASKALQKIDAKKVTVEQLISMMDKIIESQNAMKSVMKRISEEITDSNLSFIQAYELVQKKQPVDPMEELGISMSDFDELLDKYQEDPRVLDSIARIMGPSEEDLAGDDGKILSVKELVDIHQYMLDELMQISAEVKKSKTSTDARTTTATAQVLVGARVESKFKVTSPAVERSVMVHQNQLATNHQFATINMMMQQAMAELMGDGQVIGRE
jgi:hypothetical protein